MNNLVTRRKYFWIIWKVPRFKSIRRCSRPWPPCSSLDVPFPSSREAVIALRSLSPDREPRKGGISKQLSVSGSTLSVWETPSLLHTSARRSLCLRPVDFSLCVFQAVERRWSSNPPCVRELVSGSSVARFGDNADVRTSGSSVKQDEWFRTLWTSEVQEEKQVETVRFEKKKKDVWATGSCLNL